MDGNEGSATAHRDHVVSKQPSRLLNRLANKPLTFLLLGMASGTAFAQSSTIIGTWELVYVAPADIQLTEPRGITNTKMHFTSDGKVVALKPDETLTDTARRIDYRFDGTSLTLIQGGQSHTVGVSFPGPDTMLLSPTHTSQRRFRRIADPNIQLEPRSLQLIKVRDLSSREPAYDTQDYSALARDKRIQGVWEIIGYRKVPRNQAPPYGFFNDIWAISGDKVSITRREPQSTDTLPYSLVNDTLTLSAAVLEPTARSALQWKVSFNKWGHLVLDRPDVEITLKLISKSTDQIPQVPIKVVLLSLAGA